MRISRAFWVGIVAAVLVPTAVADEAPPERRRVATLLPFVEDALRLAPQRVQVVATVRRSLHVPVPEGTIDLGNPHSPSFERLVEARPELLIGDATVHAALAPKIERLGIELLLLETAGVESTFSELVRVGARVGIEEEMQAAVSRARSELSANALEDPLPTLALFGTPQTFFAVTPRTWLGDLMAQLNLANVGNPDHGDERYPGLVALSDEALAMLRPKMVVLVAHGDPAAIERAFQKKMEGGGPWRSVRESAAGNVHVLDPKLFSANPGLALPRAAQALAALVHGEGA